MMLEYVGHGAAGQRIEAAVMKALAAGVGLTEDLHGDGTTTTLTDQIIKNLGA
jgi:isocitrate dehydrogenase (NAD+)